MLLSRHRCLSHRSHRLLPHQDHGALPPSAGARMRLAADDNWALLELLGWIHLAIGRQRVPTLRHATYDYQQRECQRNKKRENVTSGAIGHLATVSTRQRVSWVSHCVCVSCFLFFISNFRPFSETSPLRQFSLSFIILTRLSNGIFPWTLLPAPSVCTHASPTMDEILNESHKQRVLERNN
jgi:hypothetical protein